MNAVVSYRHGPFEAGSWLEPGELSTTTIRERRSASSRERSLDQVRSGRRGTSGRSKAMKRERSQYEERRRRRREHRRKGCSFPARISSMKHYQRGHSRDSNLIIPQNPFFDPFIVSKRLYYGESESRTEERRITHDLPR